jgi:hypothetical protein
MINPHLQTTEPKASIACWDVLGSLPTHAAF